MGRSAGEVRARARCPPARGGGGRYARHGCVPTRQRASPVCALRDRAVDDRRATRERQRRAALGQRPWPDRRDPGAGACGELRRRETAFHHTRRNRRADRPGSWNGDRAARRVLPGCARGGRADARGCIGLRGAATPAGDRLAAHGRRNSARGDRGLRARSDTRRPACRRTRVGGRRARGHRAERQATGSAERAPSGPRADRAARPVSPGDRRCGRGLGGVAGVACSVAPAAGESCRRRSGGHCSSNASDRGRCGARLPSPSPAPCARQESRPSLPRRSRSCC